MTDGSMNDMTWSMYGVEHVRGWSRRPGRAAGGGSVPFTNHVADLAEPRVAAERQRLARAPS